MPGIEAAVYKKVFIQPIRRYLTFRYWRQNLFGGPATSGFAQNEADDTPGSPQTVILNIDRYVPCTIPLGSKNKPRAERGAQLGTVVQMITGDHLWNPDVTLTFTGVGAGDFSRILIPTMKRNAVRSRREPIEHLRSRAGRSVTENREFLQPSETT
jgi:hypothetical protein